MKLIFTIFLTIFLSLQVFPQSDENPANWCRNGLFPSDGENFKIAKIKAKKGERVYFYGDSRKECPAGQNCQKNSYLIANDEVIVSKTFGNFGCSWYQPKSGAETVGWIQLSKLTFRKNDFSGETFLGNWSYNDNSIEISKTDTPNLYKVSGNAFWKGIGDNVHIGEIGGEAKFSEMTLKYNEDDTDEYACKVTMRGLGSYLIVSDNMNCGGANVTFSGVYRKIAK